MRLGRVILALLLFCPLFYAVNVNIYFYKGEQPEQYVVTCGEATYSVYLVRSGPQVSAAVVLKGGNIIQNFAEYNKAVQTAWYYAQIVPVVNNISFYTTDTAASLQSLANRLQNKHYDLMIAESRLRDLNLYTYATQVESLDSEREYILEKIRSLATELSTDAKQLITFINNPYCGFSIDMQVYGKFNNVYTLLSGYNQKARDIMAALAQINTNSESSVILGRIIDYISPPFDMSQLDSLHASAVTEKELFSQVTPLTNVRKLYTDYVHRVDRARYLTFMSRQITSVGTLSQTVAYILQNWPLNDPRRKELEKAWQELQRLVSQGDYRDALTKAQAIETLAVQMVNSGPPSSGTPILYYAAVIIVALLIIVFILRKRGGSSGEEEDMLMDVGF